MAYQYDEFGNIIGEYETDEERKKREAELANTAVQTHEVKTYGDGSQTQTVTQEIPAGTVAGPVAPTLDQTTQRQNVQPAVVAAPVAPTRTMAPTITPDQQAAYIAQQESGNNPNIGYHNPSKGTAYGTYGLTAPAYADVQRVNPAFAGRGIETLTPEEQTKAYQTYTAMNAGQLQRNGIEPTPGNLAAAHFLGATGLKNYLTTGEISPAAARANGGEENVRRIVEGRLAQGAAPSSGALNQPAQPVTPNEQYSLATGQTGLGLQAPGQQGPRADLEHPAMPAINAYQAAQDNPLELLKLRNDETQPAWIRERAGRQAADLMKMELEKKDAGEQAKTLIAGAASGDPRAANQVAKALQNQEGSWLKMILLGFISPQMAGEEAIKLGFGNKWAPAMDAQGNAGLVEYNAKGLPLRGTKADGTPMDEKELTAYASSGAGKTSDVSLTMHQALVDGKLHTFESKRTPAGLMYRDATANGGWTRNAPEGMSNIGQQDPAHVKGLAAANSVVTKMSKANSDAIAATGRPQFTQEQIQQARDQAYANVTGKQFTGQAAATGPAGTVPVNAPGTTAPAVTAPSAAPAKGPKTLAQQILDYEAPPPVGPSTGTKIAIMNEVNRLAAEQGKTFNAGNFKIASNFNNSQSGKALKSINVAVDHLDTLQEAANELKNGQTPAFNKIANLYATNTGSTAPGNFDALKSIVGSEVAKAVVGGASALGDREEIRKEIDNAKTPEQLAGVINKFQALMAGQAKGIRQEWVSSGLDESRFDDKLMPRTKVVLNKQKEPSRSKW